MGTSTTTTAATVEVTRRPALRAFGRAAVMVTLWPGSSLEPLTPPQARAAKR